MICPLCKGYPELVISEFEVTYCQYCEGSGEANEKDIKKHMKEVDYR